MKKLLNSSIFIAITVLALAATGCARTRPEAPVPSPTPRAATAIPASLDGTPTVLTVVATATPPPILGTPTPLQLKPTATASEAVTGNAGGAVSPTAPPTSAPTAAPPPATGSGSEIVHIVQPGENLFRIGLHYGVDAATLAAYNGISDPTLIYVGQKIRIPVSGGGYTGSSGQIYVVQPGDTLYTIAVSFNVTVQALMNANGISDPDTIYIGQKLIVP